MTRIVEVEYSGVRAIYAETEGDNMVSLRFRVGAADESLADRGYTHLAEHLALSSLTDAPYAVNGWTGQCTTGLAAVGAPGNQARFLAHVADRLANIAEGAITEDEIRHETRILQAEDRRRSANVFTELHNRLFGAQGYGTAVWPEFGLHDIDVERFRNWTRWHFCKENAVIAFHNAPPDPVALDRLSGGRYVPSPEPIPQIDGLPGYINALGSIGILAVIPRGIGNPALALILARELAKRLRGELAASYAPRFVYELASSDRGLMSGLVDVRPDSALDAAEAVVGIIDRLATEGPTQEEIDHLMKAWSESMDRPGAGAKIVEENAEGLALGGEVQTVEDVQRHLDATDADLVRERASLLWSGCLVCVPPGVSLDHAGVARVAEWPEQPIPPGRAFHCRTAFASSVESGQPRIVLSDSALSLVEPGTAAVTIKRDEVALLKFWRDGAHQVLGRHGRSINLLGSRWQGYPQVVEVIRTWVEPHEKKDMGFRSAAPDSWKLPVRYGNKAERRVAWVETRVHRLDNANRHFANPAFGLARSLDRAFVRGGLLLGWLADKRLLAKWVEEGLAEALVQYRAGEVDRVGLYREAGGILATDMVPGGVRPFLVWLYSPQTAGKDDSRIALVFGALETGLADRYDLEATEARIAAFDAAVDQLLSRGFARALPGPARRLKAMMKR